MKNWQVFFLAAPLYWIAEAKITGVALVILAISLYFKDILGEK